jgi:leucyl-tRNA synthetase
MARQRPKVQAHIDGRQVMKVVVVPAKLVNFVVR